MEKPRIDPNDRIMVEAMKKGIYSISFADGSATYYPKGKDKLLAHDVAIAVQSYLIREKERNDNK